MSTENFTANVQYDDLLGTVAADDSDDESLRSWMIDQGHIDDDELVLGIEMYTGDSYLDEDNPLRATVYVGNKNNCSIKQLKLDMSMNAFISCFKRLHIMLSRGGDLTGQDLEIDEIIDIDGQ
jgi:hypothetical protein